MVGMRPAPGRPFARREYIVGRNRVAIISHTLWEQRFHLSRSVLGEIATLNSKPYTIVGVAPAGFRWRLDWRSPAAQV